MDDLHFLERLERVATHQADLALALYRAPELVRYVLDLECAPEQPRIAISLGDPHLGPFVIVTRTGNFVTCLATGMRTSLPIITKARLDDLRARHTDFNQRLMFMADADERSVRAVWRALMGRAHRVPREAMIIAAMVAPLMQAEMTRALQSARARVYDQLREANRLVARVGRWSAHDLELLERLWTDTWQLAHFTLLDACQHPDDLAARHRALLQDGKLSGLDLWYVGMSIPFAPFQVRNAWAFMRLGAVGLEIGTTAMHTIFWHSNRAALIYQLTGLALARPELRPQIKKLIVTRHPSDTELDDLRGLAGGVLDHPDNDGVSRRELVRNGRLALGLPRLEREALTVEAARPQALPLMQLGATLLSNVFSDALGEREQQTSMTLLAWLARAEADELYWSQVDLDRFEKPWRPEDTHQMLVGYTSRPSLARAANTQQPTIAAPKPGRNDACACGSGKKFKRCCGA